jgi:hypothetical protein
MQNKLKSAEDFYFRQTDTKFCRWMTWIENGLMSILSHVFSVLSPFFYTHTDSIFKHVTTVSLQILATHHLWPAFGLMLHFMVYATETALLNDLITNISLHGRKDSHMEVGILRGLLISENINCSTSVVCRAKNFWRPLLLLGRFYCTVLHRRETTETIKSRWAGSK